MVTGGGTVIGNPRRARDRIVDPAGFRQAPGEGQLRSEIYLPGWQERLGPFEQIHRGSGVAAVHGTTACHLEVSCRVAGQPVRVVIGRAQLAPVAEGLLQMVADDLVQLYQAGAAPFEPPGEPFMKLCPVRFRERLVGGVTDQQVAEPECFLTWEDGTIRAQKILSDQRHQPPGNVPFLWCHDLHGAAVKGLPFDRSALQHGAVLGPELIKPGGEQSLDGGRHRQVAADRLADQSEHLFDEQRVARRSRLQAFLRLSVHADAQQAGRRWAISAAVSAGPSGSSNMVA